ncbi:unnamed protein product [Effrenium voratum]|nr:unnamed protein product [Effrenium voratum]CAJ1427172.1 unnamed protein product [Effrenium voratum]
MAGEKLERPTRYMYEDPPTVLAVIWCLGIFCAICTCTISAFHMRSHFKAAREQGLGHHELLMSLGPRADRVIQLLLVPAFFSVTGAAQMLVPGADGILSFLRIAQLSFAMVKIVELLFLLSGSQQHILDNLPKEPVNLFAKFPMCLFCGFRCCAHRVRLGHLRFFVAGLQQFVCIMPMVGAIDVYLQTRGEVEDADTLKVLGTIVALSTFFGLWSFKCLLPLIADTIFVEDLDPGRVAAMERFILLQMMAVKLLGMIVPKLVTENLQGPSWEMPNQFYVSILNGFMMCLVQLPLAILGSCAYTADEGLYPELDYEADLPPDAIALMDMSGIDPSQWKRLRRMSS